MFLKPKKGNLVAQFVVLLVIAVILIFVVSSFGAKIWQAFFPSADKSTMKSFDAVFNVFNAKGVSEQDYDSTTMNIYLKDGYKILFFANDGKLECKESHWYGPTISTAYAPKACKANEQCMCLYKTLPAMDVLSTDKKAREKNLVKCYSFENDINIDQKYFDLNRIVCDPKNIKPYGSYMFIKRVIYPEAKGYVYVLEANDTNKELDANWSIPVCKATDSNNPCYQKRDGDTVTATDQESLTKIYNFCSNVEGVQYKSLSVKCEYPQGGTDCKTNCKDDDVTPQCGVIYNTCEDYNHLIGTMGNTISSTGYKFIVNYISEDEEYKYYGMCKNNVIYCNVNGGANCFITTWDVYACRDSPTGTVYTPFGTNKCLSPQDDPDLKSANITCNVEFLKDVKEEISRYGGFESFITSYDINNADCKKYMENNFYDKQSIMTCREDKTDECKKFVDDKTRKCDLKLIQFGQEYWITHYALSCEDEVKTLFTIVSLCKSG